MEFNYIEPQYFSLVDTQHEAQSRRSATRVVEVGACGVRVSEIEILGNSPVGLHSCSSGTL
jgi:hypothetical protein